MADISLVVLDNIITDIGILYETIISAFLSVTNSFLFFLLLIFFVAMFWAIVSIFDFSKYFGKRRLAR